MSYFLKIFQIVFYMKIISLNWIQKTFLNSINILKFLELVILLGYIYLEALRCFIIDLIHHHRLFGFHKYPWVNYWKNFIPLHAAEVLKVHYWLERLFFIF
jgi:hypothetical protein